MIHVWSTYEWRNAEDGPVEGRGINSIQRYHDGKRWWITSWIYDSERDDNSPITTTVKGTPPWGGPDLGATVPGAPGETHVIGFKMRANKPGPWENCAEMTSDLFQGTNISCASGEVTSKRRGRR
jgi:hypothetical protein